MSWHSPNAVNLQTSGAFTILMVSLLTLLPAAVIFALLPIWKQPANRAGWIGIGHLTGIAAG